MFQNLESELFKVLDDSSKNRGLLTGNFPSEVCLQGLGSRKRVLGGQIKDVRTSLAFARRETVSVYGESLSTINFLQ